MSRNKKSNIVDDTIYLFDYKNYWIEDTAQGHLIKICHGANDRILEIDCRWKKRKRDKYRWGKEFYSFVSPQDRPRAISTLEGTLRSSMAFSIISLTALISDSSLIEKHNSSWI
jgi:hypothetical protein